MRSETCSNFRLPSPALLVAGAAFLSAAGTSFATEYPAEATITEVTVFGSGAVVTRQAGVSVVAGEHVLILQGLPPSFLHDTVRVSAGGDASVMIGSVEIRRIETAALFAERERELTTQIRALAARQTLLNDGIRSAELQIGFLQALSTGYGGEGGRQVAEGRADVTGWTQALALIGNGADAAYARIRTSRDELVDVQESINALQRELRRIGSGARREFEIRVPFSAEASGTATFSLNFMVNNAGWAPTYEARLDAEAGQMRLISEAAVRQNTGEAWDNVALTLTTGQPSEDAQLPPLNPWFVDILSVEEIIVTGSRIKRAEFDTVQPSAVVDSEFVDSRGFGRVAGALNEVPAFGISSVSDSGFSTEYAVPGRVSVSATGDAQQFRLDERDVEAGVLVKTAPALEARAYLYGRFTNDGDAPLFGGELKSFVGGVFTGSAYLPTTRPGEEAEIAFGADERVAVNYTNEGTRKSTEGLIRKDEVIAFPALIEIENFHDRAITLEVYGRIPVSQNEKITVKIMESATPADEREVDDIPGLLKWNRELEAGATVRIRRDFQITYPEGSEISHDN